MYGDSIAIRFDFPAKIVELSTEKIEQKVYMFMFTGLLFAGAYEQHRTESSIWLPQFGCRNLVDVVVVVVVEKSKFPEIIAAMNLKEN